MRRALPITLTADERTTLGTRAGSAYHVVLPS